MDDIHGTIARFYTLAATSLPDSFSANAIEAIEEIYGIECVGWMLESGHSEYRTGPVLVSDRSAEENADDADVSRQEVTIDGASHRFRFRPAKPTKSAKQEQLLQTHLYHVANAWSLCRRYSSAGAPKTAVDAKAAHAVVDFQGNLNEADQAFMDLLSEAGCEMPVQKLPFDIVWNAKLEKRGLTWRGLYFRISRNNRFFRLLAHKDRKQSKIISEREWSVLHELALGKNYRQIGEALNIAPTTTSSHVYNMYAKLGFAKKTELVQWYNAQAVRID